MKTALETLKTQAESTTQQMMTGINSAIVTRSATVKSSATACANGIVNGLDAMVSGGTSAANRMMDGMLSAMNAKAGTLYAKAKEIADNIAATIKAALDVHSPSRVMIDIFENVMMGIYEGMDNLSGLLYNQAEGISDKIAEKLTISPEVADDMAARLQAVTDATLFNSRILAPAGVGGGTGGTTYNLTFVNNITTPKPLSESEITREQEDFAKRVKHLLP